MRHGQLLEPRPLRARAVSYQYRFCPRCRREWPAKYQSCPECVHWLGERPLERVEWQLTPAKNGYSAPQGYELVNACALVLRIVRDHPPTDAQSAAITEVLNQVLAVKNGAPWGIAGQGWLVSTPEGLRPAFRRACEIEQRLAAALPRLEDILHHGAPIRWGIWIDRHVLPCDRQNGPAIADVTATAIFNFEPDCGVLASEAVYQANRPWEHFVCVPRRLLDGQEVYGYRMTGHKRPSALDHAATGDSTPFIGRERELSTMEQVSKRAAPTAKLAITAPAGSGKTRLIKEWLKRHPQIRSLTANFSLFGGAVEEFASQLAELPPDGFDCDALVEAVAARVRRDQIDVLVLDDLHWAGPDGFAFIHRLLIALPPTGMLIILASRPSGRQWLDPLQPTRELSLKPLPKPATAELARRLMASEAGAAAVTRRSKGNPLFVEQFAAWAAETNFKGGESGPHSLHEIVAARIERLSKVRMADIQRRLRWGGSSERQAIDQELGRLELEVGRWLDRLETGDYADRVEAAHHLVALQRLDYEIFLASMLAGRSRPRSSRLREALERLLIGSADQILADLKRRATKATGTVKENIAREAQRVAEVLFAAFNWGLAGDFYELAYSDTLWDKGEIGQRLAQCRLRSQDAVSDDGEVYAFLAERSLDERPSVSTLDLPYVWAHLGRRYRSSRYFARAGEAAVVIHDYALAAWAQRKAVELRMNEEAPARS